MLTAALHTTFDALVHLPTLVLQLRAPRPGARPFDPSSKGYDPLAIWLGHELFDDFERAASSLAGDVARAVEEGAYATRYIAQEGTWHAVYRRQPGDDPAGVTVTTLVAFQPWPQSQAMRRQLPALASTNSDNERLHAVLAHAPAAIAVLKWQGDTLTYGLTNITYERLVGASGLYGKPFGSVFQVADEAPELARIVHQVARTGERREAKQFSVKLDWERQGRLEEKFFDVVCEPITDAESRPTGLTLFAYDVSDQVRARRLAEARETHFRHLADCLPQIVWTANRKGEIDWINERGYAYRGLPPSDPNSRLWECLLHPDDQAVCQRAWAASLAQSSPLVVEVRLRNLEGDYRWFLIQALPLDEDWEGAARWFGSSTDVHDQKIVHERFTELMDVMNDGYFAVDKDWRIISVNAKHCRQTQKSREEQIGQNVEALFFSSEELKKSLYWEKYQEAARTRVAIFFEAFYAPLNIWTAVNVYPTAQGSLAIIYRDISAEKRLKQNIEAEKLKFESLFLDAPASMALLRGSDLVFEKANAQYMAVVGHRPIIGHPMHEALPELVGQPFLQLMRRVFETGEPYFAKDMPAYLTTDLTKPPQRLYFDFTYSRVDTGEGEPYGVYIHATNVTEKFLALKRADGLARNLEQAIEARDDFLSSASHELKTPVTSIKMQLQMTRRKVKPADNKVPSAEKLAHTLDLCTRQIDRLAALIEDLLDVSRISAGKMTFNFAQVNVAQIVRDTVAQFEEQLRAAGCKMTVTLPETLETRCDGFRIEQVVTNLVTNAIKYGAGSDVHVAANQTEEGGVRLAVTDQGMGIAQDKQKKIFDRFERAISHNNVSGLGLGLFICKQIVLAHRGRIGVQSELGRGSTFTVELPNLAQAQQPAGPIER